MRFADVRRILSTIYQRTTLLEGTIHLLRGTCKMGRVAIISRYWRHSLGKAGKRLNVFPGVRLEFPKNITVGNGFSINRDSYIRSENLNAKIIIGDDVDIGMRVKIDGSGGLEINDRSMISNDVVILTHIHGADGLDPHGEAIFKKLTIGKGTWIAVNAIILPQVTTIGEGAVIGAGAVVTKDVPSWTVVGGNPARPIGTRKQPLASTRKKENERRGKR